MWAAATSPAALPALQQENIRLLVTSLDPSLTAKHITEAYRLPEGMVTLLDQEQCAALEAAPAEDAPCCMYHQKGFASLTGGRQGPERRDHGHHGADGVGAVLSGHCGAAHQRPQHLAAAGDLCADVSGGMERPEHRRVRPETA